MINLTWKCNERLIWCFHSIFWIWMMSCISRTSSCGQMLSNTGSGRVRSPYYPQKYPPKLDCKWTIANTFGAGIKLEIESLDNKELSLSGSTGRCYDHLDIYQRFSRKRRSRLGKSLCGNSLADVEHPILYARASSSGNTTVEIEFDSDYAGSGKGFSIAYTAMCNEAINASEGTVSSPNHPNPYPKDAKCVTTIRTPSGTRAQLTFNEFHLESSIGERCKEDYVDVTYDDSKFMAVNEKFCGNSLPPVITSYSNKIVILFKSNSYAEFKGFNAVWSTAVEEFASSSFYSPTSSSVITTGSFDLSGPSREALFNDTIARFKTHLQVLQDPLGSSNPLKEMTSPTTSPTKPSISVLDKIVKSRDLRSSLTSPESNRCSTTAKGYTCQRWDSSTPHKPRHLPVNRGHNYCRSPDNDTIAWCYTTSPSQRWDYCNLEDCVTTQPKPDDETTTVPMTSSPRSLFTTSNVQSKQSVPTLITNQTEASPPIVLQRNGSGGNPGTNTVYYIVVCIAVLVVIVTAVLVFLIRTRRNKRVHFPVDDNEIIFNRNQGEDAEATNTPRLRENTYVEIPLLPGDGEGKSLQAAMQSRRSTTESIDSVAAAKLEAIVNEGGTHQTSPSFSLQNRNSMDDSGVYAMADYQPITVVEETTEEIPENPYHIIDPVEEQEAKPTTKEESWYVSPTSPPFATNSTSLYDRPTSVKVFSFPDKEEECSKESDYTPMDSKSFTGNDGQGGSNKNQCNNKSLYEPMQPQWE